MKTGYLGPWLPPDGMMYLANLNEGRFSGCPNGPRPCRVPLERRASPDYEQFHRPLRELFVEQDGRFVIPAPDAMRPEDV